MVEIGGLVLYAFHAVFGNADVMAMIFSWTILLTFIYAGIEIYRFTKDQEGEKWVHFQMCLTGTFFGEFLGSF